MIEHSNALISVIIPVYKVEKYLCQCIESTLAQTYQNLEIILVNDGSPDNCGAICDEYAKKDARIKVIHKHNGGLSDARNAGIEIATGELISFVDSDDWIESNMIEILSMNLIDYNADISCCSYYMSYANANIPFNSSQEILVFTNEQAVECILLNKREHLTPIACGKLYKKRVFDDVRYPLGRIHEDGYVIIDVLSKARVIVSNLTPMYYYRQRSSGIMHTYAHRWNEKRVDDFLHLFDTRLKTIEKLYPDMFGICKRQFLDVNFEILNQIIRNRGYKRTLKLKKTFSTIRDNYDYIMTMDFFTRKEKIKTYILRRSLTLYKLMISTNNFVHRISESTRNLTKFD